MSLAPPRVHDAVQGRGRDRDGLDGMALPGVGRLRAAMVLSSLHDQRLCQLTRTLWVRFCEETCLGFAGLCYMGQLSVIYGRKEFREEARIAEMTCCTPNSVRVDVVNVRFDCNSLMPNKEGS